MCSDWILNPLPSISHIFPEPQIYAKAHARHQSKEMTPKNGFLPIASLQWRMTLPLCIPIVSNLKPPSPYYVPHQFFSFPNLLGAHPPSGHIHSLGWVLSPGSGKESEVKPIPVISFCLLLWIWALADVDILGMEKGGKSTGKRQGNTPLLFKRYLMKSPCFSASLCCYRGWDIGGRCSHFVTREASQRPEWPTDDGQEEIPKS